MKKNVTLALALVATLAACKKPEEGAAPAGSATLTSADPCGPIVEKLASKAKTPPDAEQRRVFGEVCKAISPSARTCLTGAPDMPAVDKCLEPEKEKVMAVVMGNAMAKDKEKAGKPSVAKLAKIGVALDVTGDAEVSDGIGKDSQMFGNEKTGTVIVSEVPARSKKTLAAAKKDATQLLSAKNVKDGTLPGGYWLTWENTGSAGKNYFVEAQVEVGKKAYRCETTASDEAHQTGALAACKSLRAAN